MKKNFCENIILSMQKIVDKTVKYYKDDFEKDKEILMDSKSGTVYIWIARKHGTNIMYESYAWLKNTFGNASCSAYLNQSDTKAYFIEIEKIQKGKVSGWIMEIDKKKLLQSIETESTDIGEIHVLDKAMQPLEKIEYKEYKKNKFYYYQKWEKDYSGFHLRYIATDIEAIKKIEKRNKEYRRIA